MAWTQDATSKAITHSGTTAEVWGLTRTLPDATTTSEFPIGRRLRVFCASFDHNIRVRIFAAEDYDTAWEVGIMADAGEANTDLNIRRIIDNVPGAPVQTIAHGLASNQPFELQVEYVNNTIKGTIIASSLAASVQATHTNTSAPTFLLNNRAGIVSDVDNAVVTRVGMEEAVYSGVDENEVLVGAAGASLWACYDGTTLERIGTNALPASGVLTMAEYAGKAYIVGQQRARVFDVLNRSIADWVPNSGTLPSGTGGGTTSALQVIRKDARLGLVDNQDRQILWSAVGDPLDFDVGLQLIDAGGAYSTGAGGNFRFGEDLIGAMTTTDGTVLIACQFSMFALLGDPVFGQINQVPVTLDSGASSFAAMASIDVSGRTFIHTPDGGVVLPNAGGGGYNLTRTQIRDGMNFPRGERNKYHVTCVRDTQRGHLWVLRTIWEPAAGEYSEAWCYDEDRGQYAKSDGPGFGGWFPMRFPSTMEPLTACLWKGRMLLGCRDGYIRELVDAQDTDDGTAIDAYMPLSLVDVGDIETGVRVTSCTVLGAGDKGDMVVRIYGGPDPEYAWSRTRRRRHQTFRTYKGTNNRVRGASAIPVADGSVVLEVSGHTSAAWAFEDAEVKAEPCTILRGDVTLAGVPPAPCREPAAAGGGAVTPPFTTGDGTDGPGANAPPGGYGGSVVEE